MNVYDFDDTIYDGDTNRDLMKYSLKKYPFLVIKALIKTIIPFIKYKIKKIPFERVKEVMLSFIFEIPEYNKFIKSFVKDHMKNIKSWYKVSKNDIILSASYYAQSRACNYRNPKRFLPRRAAWPWLSLLTHFDKSPVLTSPPAGV